MSNFPKVLLYMLIVAFILSSCSGPTKCECKEELEKLMTQTALSGRAITSDLSEECDRTYQGVEAYMNEQCPDKK